MPVAGYVAEGVGPWAAVEPHSLSYSAAAVDSHRAADSEAVAGARFVVALAAARRYLAFAYR